jgi:anti-anti-sigma factor
MALELPESEPSDVPPPRGRTDLVSVVRLVGEQDATTVDELRARLGRACDLDPRGLVEADLHEVTFMSFASLSVLAQTKLALAGRFRLTAVSEPVRRLIALTGLDSVLGPVPAEAHVLAETPESSHLMELAELEAEVTALREATQSRAAIEQAKGLLMGVNGCDAEHAWTLLVRAASGAGVRVRDLARALTAVAAGEQETVSPAGHVALRELTGSAYRQRGPR